MDFACTVFTPVCMYLVMVLLVLYLPRYVPCNGFCLYCIYPDMYHIMDFACTVFTPSMYHVMDFTCTVSNPGSCHIMDLTLLYLCTIFTDFWHPDSSVSRA